jgi:transcription initiation factor TFIIB
MPVDDPVDYVTKIAETAGTSSEVEGVAIKLIQIAKIKKAIMGKDPSGLAAAALYIASRIRNEKIKQHQLAKAANITEVTIRNRKKDLIKRLDLGKKRTAWTKTARDMGLT